MQVSILLEQRAQGRGHVVHHHVGARWKGLRQRQRVSGTRDVSLVSLSIARPISALLHVFECPSVRVLPHALRWFYGRALLGLTDVLALNLGQAATGLLVITLIAPVTPLTVATVLLMIRRIGTSLTIMSACLLLQLHPAIGLRRCAQLRRRPLRQTIVGHLSMGAVGVRAVRHLEARGGLLSLLLATLETGHVGHRFGLIHVQLRTVRRHLSALIRHRGLQIRYLTIGRHHRPGALTGRLTALRVRMVDGGLVGHRRLLSAVRRQLRTVSRRTHLHALLLGDGRVIRRGAARIRVMVHLAGWISGAVCVHLSLATVVRVITVVHVALGTVPG